MAAHASADARRAGAEESVRMGSGRRADRLHVRRIAAKASTFKIGSLARIPPLCCGTIDHLSAERQNLLLGCSDRGCFQIDEGLSSRVGLYGGAK